MSCTRDQQVTRQEAYVSGNDGEGAPNPPPCPEPSGGWHVPDGEVTGARAARLSRVIRQHPDELNGLHVVYPYGYQPDPMEFPDVMVNTTGDVATARSC